jgi:hypothetical protein
MFGRIETTCLYTGQSTMILKSGSQTDYLPAIMLRLLIILAEMVAVLCMSTSTAMNAIAHTPNSTKSAIIRPLLQAYVKPPYCRARRRQTMLGIIKNSPKRSRFFSRSIIGISGLTGGKGSKMKKMTSKANPPIGRLTVVFRLALVQNSTRTRSHLL